VAAVMQDDLSPMPLDNGFDDRQAQAAARHIDVLTTGEAAWGSSSAGERRVHAGITTQHESTIVVQTPYPGHHPRPWDPLPGGTARAVPLAVCSGRKNGGLSRLPTWFSR